MRCAARPAVLLVALLGGCAAAPPATLDPPAPATAPAAGAADGIAAPPLQSIWPISIAAYRTTSAQIYLGNLDARIAMLEGRVAAGHAERGEVLAAQRYHRYKVLGRLDDADRAIELLAERAERDQLTPGGMVLYATTLSGVHRFDEAERWLARARDAGAKPGELRDVTADLRVARGHYAALADDLASAREPIADFYALAHRADLRLLQGDLGGAERHYLTAQTLYNDVSPVPLAWLHTQMGIAYLRHGRIDDARRFFAAAVERLPGYYLAEEHLAECETLLGETDTARERYRRVIAQTGNPEFIAALAGLERAAGNAAEADALAKQAKDGYDALLRRLPDAYAQHAAEFFIEIGDPGRAFALASNNATLRQDVGSLILLATAAHAAGRDDVACEARTKALATGFTPPEIAELDALAESCSTAASASQNRGQSTFSAKPGSE